MKKQIKKWLGVKEDIEQAKINKCFADEISNLKRITSLLSKEKDRLNSRIDKFNNEKNKTQERFEKYCVFNNDRMTDLEMKIDKPINKKIPLKKEIKKGKKK